MLFHLFPFFCPAYFYLSFSFQFNCRINDKIIWYVNDIFKTVVLKLIQMYFCSRFPFIWFHHQGPPDSILHLGARHDNVLFSVLSSKNSTTKIFENLKTNLRNEYFIVKKVGKLANNQCLSLDPDSTLYTIGTI